MFCESGIKLKTNRSESEYYFNLMSENETHKISSRAFCESEIKFITNSDTYKELSINLSIGSTLSFERFRGGD